MTNLLTTGNPKTEKGNGLGYLTAILHLAPATMSGHNVCPWSSAGCRAACLNTAGRGGIQKSGVDPIVCQDVSLAPNNLIQLARIRRTNLFYSCRQTFLAKLHKEIRQHVKRAEKHNLAPAVRLNGTSDLPWEKIDPTLFSEFPTVQFYDYTKGFSRMVEYCAGDLPTNYSLTFSKSETNEPECRVVLKHGGNVAVVFNTKKSADLPEGYLGSRVVDGDVSDLRFLDGDGVVVGLRAKGRAKSDESGFVVDSADGESDVDWLSRMVCTHGHGGI
ncbi:MAG: GP88 family protein [Planctomycetota bacterium]|jgi:hypothetical protein